MSTDRSRFGPRPPTSDPQAGQTLPREALSLEAEGFRGASRFTLLRRIGAGTFGVVFEALDKERQEKVALKLLRRASPSTIYRFKQEFRALSHLIHPNLVSLYELIQQEEQWYFTMELIDGCSFFDHLQMPTFSQESAPTTLGERGAEVDRVFLSTAGPAINEDKLRAALGQLVEGVGALHAAGKLHRDIKPSNVMLERDGRLVLLDFGLVVERDSLQQEQEHYVVGTALYMSPEQAAATELSEASDWYSVGAILYQALTGRLPFEGAMREILSAKQAKPAPPVQEVAPKAPTDLADLANELLLRSPTERPKEHELRRRLGLPAARKGSQRRGYELLGREQQLGALRASFSSVQTGAASFVMVRGASGMGKSSLVSSFVSSLSEPEALVLQGRCYERESVPYKVFDGLLDALSRRISPELFAALPPKEGAALTRVFPVLAKLTEAEQAEDAEPIDTRQKAFEGLRSLFVLLSRQKPLVLYVDDLQWGDLDSVLLLESLFAPPAPALLWIGSYRSEEEGKSPFLQALQEKKGLSVHRSVIEVGPLSKEESATLIQQRFLGAPPAEIEAISGEAQGSPYLIDELIEAYQLGLHRAPLTLEEALFARFERLPEEAKRLLEAITLVGKPVPLGVVARAAGLMGRLKEPLSLLASSRFVEAHGARESDRVESFHDRIREVLTGRLSLEAKRALHAKLAEAFLGQRHTEPETLVPHLLGADDPVRARGFVQLAAKHAESTLAFEQAARLYQLALSLYPEESAERAPLEEKLAESLVHCGRSFEAAKLYHKLSQTKTESSEEWKELAAREYLKSGRIDEGATLLREVLAASGLTMAKTARGALLSTLWGRAVLWFRGLRFTERDEIPKETLRRLELCWTVTSALGNIDTTHGSDYQTRHLLLALKSGEPYQICRALSAEAVYLALGGASQRARVEAVLKQAEDIAHRLQNSLAIGVCISEHGNIAMLFGEWRRAFELNEKAEHYIRDNCGGFRFEASTAQVRALWSMCYLGEMKELGRRVLRSIAESEQRGDLYSAVSLRAAQAAVLPLLARDQAKEAQEALTSAMNRWSPEGFHVQHYNDMIAQGEIDLYEGKGQEAMSRIEATWRRLSGSLLLYIQVARIESYQLRARIALSAAKGSAQPQKLLQLAEKDAARILKEKAPWGEALAKILLGSIFAQRRDTRRAVAVLQEAVAACDATEMHHYAAAARARLAGLLGGAGAQEHEKAAQGYFTSQEIKSPERFTAMLAPGF